MDSKDKKSLNEILDKRFPLLSFRTENGYLKLSEKQENILRERVFTPNKHIFAAVSIGDGIKFYEMHSDHPLAFRKYVEKCEKNIDCFPYTYLGFSNENGRIII